MRSDLSAMSDVEGPVTGRSGRRVFWEKGTASAKVLRGESHFEDVKGSPWSRTCAWRVSAGPGGQGGRQEPHW